MNLKQIVIVLSVISVSCEEKQEVLRIQGVEDKVFVGMTPSEVINCLGKPSFAIALNKDGSTVRDVDYASYAPFEGRIFFPYPDRPNCLYSIDFISGKAIDFMPYIREHERRERISEQVGAGQPATRP